MWANESPTLADWVEDGYDILVSASEQYERGVPRPEARERLLSDPAFADDPADAEYAIERLLNAGWIYEVEDNLRITDPETVQ